MSLTWLNDPVYSIRVAAITNLMELTKIFGSVWAERNIMGKLLELTENQNYLHRLTSLFGMAELSKVLSPDAIKKYFIPALSKLAKDKIPNIRLNVSKTILSMRQNGQNGGPVDGQVEGEILQVLNELKNDADDDVKYYTKKAIIVG